MLERQSVCVCVRMCVSKCKKPYLADAIFDGGGLFKMQLVIDGMQPVVQRFNQGCTLLVLSSLQQQVNTGLHCILGCDDQLLLCATHTQQRSG